MFVGWFRIVHVEKCHFSTIGNFPLLSSTRSLWWSTHISWNNEIIGCDRPMECNEDLEWKCLFFGQFESYTFSVFLSRSSSFWPYHVQNCRQAKRERERRAQEWVFTYTHKCASKGGKMKIAMLCFVNVRRNNIRFICSFVRCVRCTQRASALFHKFDLI